MRRIELDFTSVILILGILLLIGFGMVILSQLMESEFQERDKQVQECLASERYTFNQCVILAGDE